jgi:hypothetical protein
LFQKLKLPFFDDSGQVFTFISYNLPVYFNYYRRTLHVVFNYACTAVSLLKLCDEFFNIFNVSNSAKFSSEQQNNITYFEGGRGGEGFAS